MYSFAFRDILAISSEVFCSMFYGPVAKPRELNDPIVDDDIDPEAFRLMLKYAVIAADRRQNENRSKDKIIRHLKCIICFQVHLYRKHRPQV